MRQRSLVNYDDIEEIYEQPNDYGLLITDCSSIFFDYLIIGRLIIRASFDLEDYKRNNRDLYFEYEEVCLTPNVRSWEDVLSLIVKFRDRDIPGNYILRYRALTKRFNQYVDTESNR